MERYQHECAATLGTVVQGEQGGIVFDGYVYSGRVSIEVEQRLVVLVLFLLFFSSFDVQLLFSCWLWDFDVILFQ